MKSVFLQFSLFLCASYTANAVEVNDQYYPRYHVAPPYGWMNDPNGFGLFKGEYHLFYQFNPNSSLVPGIAHWGHVKSPDLVKWEHLPIAMYPDKSYDQGGVFSGSALIENNVMYFYYTGNINLPNENPDHEQHQALATSNDGVNVKKYGKNPIINGEEHQPNIRDPKVWKHGNSYFMVLGNSFNNNTLGRALLYKSDDKISWNQVSVLDESDGSLGFMWECPDFFELNGKFVLLFSPQGVEPQGDKYKNLYQCGYIVGEFNYNDYAFKPLTKFVELDHGHDFYATQTMLDKSGKRVVIAWNDMWEEDYPERQDGFTGQMILPRVLKLDKNNHIIQTPILSLASLRNRALFTGQGKSGKVVKLVNKAGEILIKTLANKNLEVFIESDSQTVSLSYDAKEETVTLDRGGNDGTRKTQWRPRGLKLQWRIYVDASSVELFLGQGEATFSSRFFPKSDVSVRLGSPAESLKVFSLKRTVPLPGEDFS